MATAWPTSSSSPSQATERNYRVRDLGKCRRAAGASCYGLEGIRAGLCPRRRPRAMDALFRHCFSCCIRDRSRTPVSIRAFLGLQPRADLWSQGEPDETSRLLEPPRDAVLPYVACFSLAVARALG